MRSGWARLTALFRRKKLDGDLDEQIRSHLQMLEDEYVEQGLPRGEARDR